MTFANAPFFNAFCLCLLPADNSHVRTSQNERTYIQCCLFVFIACRQVTYEPHRMTSVYATSASF